MTDGVELCAVVFDLDGLIVNSEDVYERVDIEVLRRRGQAFEPALREQMMGRPAAHSVQIMIDHHALTESVADLDAERTVLFDQLIIDYAEHMPGFMPLLDALDAAELPAAIATSGTRSYATKVLNRLGIASRFRFVLTAEDIEHGKPAPDVYQLAARKLEMLPHEVMVLEDSGNGCQAGVAANAFTVAVPNRHTHNHDFSGARFIADTLADRRIFQTLKIVE
ncbi:MAG TPA: HAD family phosphatase [Lacipirellulaceae bacterium]